MSDNTVITTMLPLSIISLDTKNALRGPQTSSAEFENLKRSMAAYGLEQPISVRPDPDNEGGYLVIDGTQRFTAAGLLGWTEIEAKIRIDVSDKESKIRQIQANVQRVVTKPAQVGKLILNILADDPTGQTTKADVAEMLCMSMEQIDHRIQLVKLADDIKEVVDRGGISIQKAVMIAGLPQEEQHQYLAMAQSDMSHSEFMQNVSDRIKQVNEAKREGRKSAAPVFTPVAKVRSKTDIENELQAHLARTSIVSKGMTALEGWDAALQWALSLDQATVAAARARFDEIQAERAKKAEAAAAKAAAAKAAAEAATEGI